MTAALGGLALLLWSHAGGTWARPVGPERATPREPPSATRQAQRPSLRECATARRRHGAHSTQHAECQHHLGKQLRSTFQHDAALVAYRRALEAYRAIVGPSDPRVADVLNDLACLHTARGAYDEAIELHRQALELRTRSLGPGALAVAQSHTNLGNARCARGSCDDAVESYEAALAIYQQALSPGHRKVALGMTNLALALDARGEHERAIEGLGRAIEIYERTAGPADLALAAPAANLAVLLQRQGRLDEAQALHERGLAIREAALPALHPDIATSLESLAVLHHQRGAPEAALPLFERALTIREASLGPHHHLVGNTLHNLATARFDLGQLDVALPLYARALAVREASLGPEHADVAVTLHFIAVIHSARGRHDEAVAARRRSEGITERMLLATPLAADDARRVADHAPFVYAADHVYSQHLQAAPHHVATGELAFATVLHRKARTQERIAEALGALRRAAPQSRPLLDALDAIRTEHAALTHAPPSARDEAHRAERTAALEHRRDELWARLVADGPVQRSLIEPPSLRDVQAALPPTGALVELVLYRATQVDGRPAPKPHPLRYAAYVARPDRLDWVDLGPASVIDEHARALRQAIQHERRVYAPARALYDAVMKPVEARLGDATELFIAPDGMLALVPFEVLLDECTTYLVERYSLRYLGSGRELLRPPAARPASTTRALVLANPAGARLPGTEREAEALRALLGDGTRVMRDGEATAVKLRDERPRVLHIATHGGVIDGDASPLDPMMASMLWLADGPLTAYEVSGWDLRGTELVTLSACMTGWGTVARGEGVLNMRRAFALAGARTQVTSLWPVADQSTTRLMVEYYRYLAAGLGRSEAMRRAQLDRLHDPATAHPYHWAAFVVTGDWTPLPIP